MSQARLDALIRETRREAQSLAEQVAAGSLSPRAFGDRLIATLEDAHTAAIVIGRQHAGDRAPVEADDRRFGEEVASGEAEFLAGFVSDLQAGRYEGDAGVVQRALLYADRVSGSANEAFALTLDPAEVFTWHLGAGEPHCEDCPDLAAGGPYTADTLPTYPRAGGTACLSRCTCHLSTESGREAFQATA